jgi:hypothetical protein
VRIWGWMKGVGGGGARIWGGWGDVKYIYLGMTSGVHRKGS